LRTPGTSRIPLTPKAELPACIPLAYVSNGFAMDDIPLQFADVLSDRIRGAQQDLAARWLHRLEDLVPAEARSIFPSQDLLDHIPVVISEIARFLAAPDDDIAANTFVTTKARDLGRLRHQQAASAHQLLREYELLRNILFTFVLEETERLALTPSASEVIRFMKRIDHAIGILTTVTVDTFIQAYTDRIDDQTRRLEGFHRMVSHELRQPLGVLLAASRVLRIADITADPQQSDRAVTAIEKNAVKLTDLIETITRLAQTRVAAGPSEPGAQRVSIATVAAEAARQIRDMADARGVDVRISPHLPSARIDVGQLELMFTNLLSNAIKYSDQSKPVRFVEVVPLHDQCGFQVRDNGVGMTSDQLRHVFTPFYRGHASEADGIGLGLTIVRDCAQSVGASVTVDGAVGEGTTFTVMLPSDLCADSFETHRSDRSD
jgi:signal transduction histidine kinase